MTKLNNSMKKKTLIITGLSDRIHSLFPDITSKNMEELIIINSYGAVISQPYGCMVRNIIMSIFNENVEEIFIIGEKENQESLINKKELLSKIYEAGISKEAIETIEYIDVIGHNLMGWLVGYEEMTKVIRENINLITKHPLIPKTVSVYGLIACAKTGQYEYL